MSDDPNRAPELATTRPPPEIPSALAPIPSRNELNVMIEISNAMASSGMQLPAGCSTPQGILTKILIGRELGLPPMVSVQEIDIIEGKASLNARCMVGLVRRRKLGDIRYVSGDAKQATVEAFRADRPEEVHRFTYTIEDAAKAELVSKKNWRRMPAAMLLARAKTTACRALFEDLFLGIAYSAEELGAEEVDEEGRVVGFVDTAQLAGIQRKPATEIKVTPAEAEKIANEIAKPSQPQTPEQAAEELLQSEIAISMAQHKAKEAIEAQQKIDADPVVQQVKSEFKAEQVSPPVPLSEEELKKRIVNLVGALKIDGQTFAKIRDKHHTGDPKAKLTAPELATLHLHLTNIFLLRRYRKEMNVPDDKWQQALAKRGARYDVELSFEKAVEFEKKLGEMLTPFKRAQIESELGITPSTRGIAGNG